MQDGATSHTANPIKAFLIQTFGEDRIVSRHCRYPWPPRSPDLTPADFWLWGYLKSRVYLSGPSSLSELKDAIHREVSSIHPDMLHSAVAGFVTRLECLLPCGGGHVEHILVSSKKSNGSKHQPFHWNHAKSRRLPANFSGEQRESPPLVKPPSILFLWHRHLPCCGCDCHAGWVQVNPPMSWYPRVATRTVLAPLADVSCLESNSFASLLPIAAQGLAQAWKRGTELGNANYTWRAQRHSFIHSGFQQLTLRPQKLPYFPFLAALYFSLKAITGESATADEGAAKIFPEELAKIIEDGDYSADQVFNADETGLYWKKLPNRTYIAKNENTATGHKASKD
ncbi:uncharacterized protein TNCV_3043451 [Trichonephila clavipes]|nr:uncharacterized protein TNCV_3043451 [Trichonephila clavipes]